MDTIASQITSVTIVYSTVYSDAVQRKHQSSASLAFVRGIHRWPVNSPHKGPVTRKMFPFDDIIMKDLINSCWWTLKLALVWKHASSSHHSLQWRNNERDSVSNRQPHHCLLQSYIQAQIKEIIKAPPHWPLWEWIPCTKGQYRSQPLVPTITTKLASLRQN